MPRPLRLEPRVKARRAGQVRRGAIGCAMLLLSVGVDPSPSAARSWWHSTAPVGAAYGDRRTVPDPAILEARRARIGRIEIRVTNVFDTDDPREDRRVFHAVNRLHRKTREGVVQRQLLFGPGDLYSERLLAETERLLRANRYFHDAEIRPVAYRDNRVDLEVTAQDVWTLTGGVRFARSGGENKVQFEVQDYNFLGTGKDLTVNRTTTVDRTSSLFRYRDYNLAGSHGRLELWFSENSDGDLRRLELERPFHALDARWAAGFEVGLDDRIDPLYRLGEVSDEFRHEHDYLETYWGTSPGLTGSSVRRWTLGLTFDRHRFTAVPDLPRADPLPPDRTHAYPWVGFELVEDEFIEIRDLDRIARTEDLNLGRRLGLRLGWSSPTFGGRRDEAIVRFSGSGGFRPGDGKLLLASAYASGRWGSDGWENLVLGGGARFFWRNFGQHLLYLQVEADVARALDPENQLLLGGDSGLRGYPLRYQAGDRRVLLTLEQRFFSNLNLFRMINVGAAVFVDAGQAWFAGPDPAEELGLLADVGFGLRLSSSRSGRGTMVHLDLAVPLGGGSIDQVQWLVTTRETF